MTAEKVMDAATTWFDSGEFKNVLARRIAIRSESQRDDRDNEIRLYLEQEITPALEKIGFIITTLPNRSAPARPMLLATRIEDPSLPTILCYGHGDVVFGEEESWREGLIPWQLIEEDDRWYGRGSADNKGQHSINITALEQIYQFRGGRLGFNCKFLFEMGEEVSSPGLATICQQHSDVLSADVFIASDGPRVDAVSPTLFLGSRGAVNVKLSINARDSDYHSGNWGGLLSNPATRLCNAISTLVNSQGQILVNGLKPPAITENMRKILREITLRPSANSPEIDVNWGESGLTPVERLYGWNTLEILAMNAGKIDCAMNAIPGQATAICQLRFVVDTDWENIGTYLTQHLVEQGFNDVIVDVLRGSAATRLDPNNPLVDWALESIQKSSGKKATLLPNLGGSLPNDVFANILKLPTLWIPHSYPSCGQHGANEHMLKSIAKEGLKIMTHLFWEFGEKGVEIVANHRSYQQKQGDS